MKALRLPLMALLLATVFVAKAQHITVIQGTTVTLHSGTAMTCANANLNVEGALLAQPTTVIAMAGSSDTYDKARTISGNGEPAFSTLKIAGNVKLERELSVSGNLIFSSGILDIQHHNINLTGDIVGETEATYLTATTGEVVSTQVVGTQLRNLLGLTATAHSSALVEVRRGHVSSRRGKDVSINRYYTFSPPITLSTFTFGYLPNEKNKVEEPQVSSFASGEWVTNPIRGTKALEVVGVELTEKITVFNEPETYIPKSFSPNGDGIGDYLEVVGAEKHTNSRLVIFSHKDNVSVLFDKTPYENNFDGTVNGTPLPEQTYFYIYYKDAQTDNTPTKGYFELVR